MQCFQLVDPSKINTLIDPALLLNEIIILPICRYI